MPRQLKVFRMPIGFEDAYVATPSRAAALRAWGTAHDQFARGMAEEVTDPALTKEPLERPGEVIRKSRGDLASQLKALGPKWAEKGQADPPANPAAPARKPVKPKPPPTRDKLDAAEALVRETAEKFPAESAGIEAQIEALESRLEALKAQQQKALGVLERKRDKAREAYRAALEKWSQ
jgi:hypothetical protein